MVDVSEAIAHVAETTAVIHRFIVTMVHAVILCATVIANAKAILKYAIQLLVYDAFAVIGR